MRKFVLASMALIICTLPSCMTVGIDEETQKKVDAIATEIKRLNDELISFQKDIQTLADEIQKFRTSLGGKK